MEGQLQMVLIAAGVLLVLGIVAMIVLMMKRTAYLGPVKEELQKEKLWLRRGEYNAAMVKGRQNLELLLKLVAEKNGIQLDNTAQAQANAREMEERQSQNSRGGKKQKTKSVMTHKEFNRWMTENGYLDRVARWEMHQVRQIGNKAVHENYSDKEDAWNQFNYLEDILKVVVEKSQSPSKRTERKGGEERAAQKPPKKQEQPKAKETPKKQNPPKAKETPKKQEQPKKKAAPAPIVAEQAAEPVVEPAKKKRRRRRPKKKTAEGNVTASVETKKAEPKKTETPKNPDAPKKPNAPNKQEQSKKQPVPKQQEQPKQEQVSAKQEQTKKKNNNNYYWRKRRKKKSSGQANAGTNASAAAAGSGGQK